MSQRRIAACLAVALAAACSDSATGVDAGAPLQGIFALQTVDGAPLPIAQRTIVSTDLDLMGTDLALSTHYFGRLDGTTLTIVRRETDVMISGQVLFPASVDLSQLVFKRL